MILLLRPLCTILHCVNDVRHLYLVTQPAATLGGVEGYLLGMTTMEMTLCVVAHLGIGLSFSQVGELDQELA